MKRWVGAHAIVWSLLIVLGVALLVRPSGADSSASRQQSDERVYVLDVNNESRDDARIVVVDPVAGRVISTLTTRNRAYQPSVALSPDGARLYIAYGVVQANGPIENLLEVLDTSTGQSLYQTKYADRWISTLAEYQYHEMSISADGRWLFLLKMSSPTLGYTQYSVTTFDTLSRAFLPTPLPLLECTAGLILPSPQDRHQVSVLCSHTQDLRLMDVSDTGGPAHPIASIQVAQSAAHAHVHISTAFRSAGGNVTAITADGEFLKVAESSRRVLTNDLVDRSAREAANGGDDWFRGRQFLPQPPVVSADGTLVYLLFDSVSGGASGHLSAVEVAVLRADSLTRVRSLRFSRRVSSLALSLDGRRLYGVDRQASALLSLDTLSGNELNPTLGVGNLPVFAVVGSKQ